MSKYARKNKVEYALSEEVAQEMVCEILDYYDIDVEALTAGESKAGAAAFENALDHISRAFRSGKLETERDKNSKLLVIQTLEGGEKLTYGEINARAKLASEKYPDANYSRIYAFMGSLSGVGKTAIEKLSPKDLAIVEVLSSVFTNA